MRDGDVQRDLAQQAVAVQKRDPRPTARARSRCEQLMIREVYPRISGIFGIDNPRAPTAILCVHDPADREGQRPDGRRGTREDPPGNPEAHRAYHANDHILLPSGQHTSEYIEKTLVTTEALLHRRAGRCHREALRPWPIDVVLSTGPGALILSHCVAARPSLAPPPSCTAPRA